MITDLKGATSPGNPALWPASSGEFAARWNAMGREAREDLVRLIVESARKAHDCWALAHVPAESIRERERAAWEMGRARGLAEAARGGPL